LQNIKILGVTFTNGLSVTPHVQHLATSNAQILYVLKILRAHGLCRMAIQAVFRSVILARLLCASPAWWGFAGAKDRQKVYSFLRRSARVGFYSSDSSSFDDLCIQADQRLLWSPNVIGQTIYIFMLWFVMVALCNRADHYIFAL